VALPAVCAILAVAPDGDLMLSAHRAMTHSVGAVIATGIAAGLIARWRRWPLAACMAIAAAAVGSHVLLDWLGRDSSEPIGIMALWPFSHAYFISGLDLFMDVSRRYWLYDEFVVHNAKAAALELALIGPFAVAAWYWRWRIRLKPDPTNDGGA
jgi:membrane-bound metal-dependent hydrolase YbcI (DUF457 family)